MRLLFGIYGRSKILMGFFYDLVAYRVESLQPQGHTVTAVMLSDRIKGRIIDTDCNKISNCTPACGSHLMVCI